MRNDHAVSHVVGYILTITITTFVVIAILYTTTVIIDERTRAAASIQARDISNQVADAVLSAVLIKEDFPNANSSRELKIPYSLLLHACLSASNHYLTQQNRIQSVLEKLHYLNL